MECSFRYRIHVIVPLLGAFRRGWGQGFVIVTYSGYLHVLTFHEKLSILTK